MRNSESYHVADAGAAGRAKEAYQRCSGPPQKARHSLRDRLLQKQGPLLALWRVRPLSLSLFPIFFFNCSIFFWVI